MDGFFPIFLVLLGLIDVVAPFILWVYTLKIRKSNEVKKHDVLRSLGVPDGEKRTLVGFFHPYW